MTHAVTATDADHRDIARHLHTTITPQALEEALRDGTELAVLDVREAGVVSRQRLLFATPAPLWRLEHIIDRLVPQRSTRIALVDGDGSLSIQAAAKLVRLGWRNVAILEGGTDAWAASGREVFTGSNVLSKAFGEVIEEEKHPPSISVDELQSRLDAGANLVVVDSRTPEEFAEFSLPFAHSLPGAELVYRIGAIAPDPATLVVVNCAGRTRSIVGAQTLIDAGIPNPVVALRDGTMAWLLSGRELAHGRAAPLLPPGDEALAAARRQAAQVAARSGVKRIDARELAELEADSAARGRTLYRFDVRTREEYEAGHLEGWRWAPGGQLVQATDEYLATRRARIVLADWDGVRALTTAAWLAQLGSFEVFTHAPAPDLALVVGPETVRVQPVLVPAPAITPLEAAALIAAGAPAFDVERRSAYEKRHAEGARFAVPDRLEALLAGEAAHPVLLFSGDGVLARIVAAELAARTGRDVRAVTGGTRAWAAAGLPVGDGAAGVLTGDDDAWRSPYHQASQADRDAGFREYLAWELGLPAQLRRAGDTGIRLAPAAHGKERP
jgi:rhodanese-related sulfurtransferase